METKMIFFLLLTLSHASKLGLCCIGCNATQYNSFANLSWAYRYSLFVDTPNAGQWLSQNNIEFVAHLAHKHVPLPEGKACNFDGAKGKTPLCTNQMLDAALQFNGKDQTMKYLMGWNEAYDQGGSKGKKKYITPTQAATWWRVYVQGMASRANLTLVSPTTGVEKNKLHWLGNMILECWAQRNQGCDVETIAAFSVHDYKCGETYWRDNYGEQGVFQTKLKKFLNQGLSRELNTIDIDTGKNWTTYVDSRRIWVTETNCNGDTGWPPTAPVSGEEQCARITGQRMNANCGLYGKCGVGSIAAMESMETVARVSWWNTWQRNSDNSTKTANAMLVNEMGILYPPGRGIVNGLLSSTDCTQE